MRKNLHLPSLGFFFWMFYVKFAQYTNVNWKNTRL